MLSPAALSIITTAFQGQHRAKALAAWGAIGGAGAALGVLLGGVLTEVADWRMIFFVNLPIAVALAIAARKVIPADTKRPQWKGLDVRGAATDDVPEGHPVDHAHRESLDVRVQTHAKIGEHALGDGRRDVAVEERQHLDGGAGAEIQRGEQQEPGRAADDQMVVDDRADDERRCQLETARGEHEQDDGDDAASPRREQARQVVGKRSRRHGLGGIHQRAAAHRRAPSTGAASTLACA